MATFGTFTKDGITREAYSIAEVVKFRFDGWTAADSDAENAPTPSNPLTAPPLVGAGSGTEAWAEYADKLGVTVPEDAKRGDIVTALKAAGHPVGDE